ncbi:MAG: amino acid carrier protein [Chlamydiia bacterium]|nr:amino acid carrier protein [Chlamydiia bacterium]
MLNQIFQFLLQVDDIFWGYFAFVLIMVLGLFLSFKAGFFQIRAIPSICKTFFHFLRNPSGGRGIHPLKAFFASVGGMIGIGNIVGIVTAVQIGGPGALVWVWIAGIIGAIIKYCEIYLGFKFRIENREGGYDGGPMYYLQKAFKTPLIPYIVAVLLCIYGVEIYQFSVITESITSNWHVPRLLVIGVLLVAVFYASVGGIQRLGRICSWVMPIFLILYILIGVWVIGHELPLLPSLFLEVFKSALNGHAAVGGFAGAGVLLGIKHGLARAAYSSDIGIGYDSIIQSESSSVHPERQSRLAILGVLLDNIICTISILIVLVSGVWKAETPLLGSELVQVSLSRYIPYMEYFIPLFFIVTGYTTIIAYFTVGIKCARFLSPKRGKSLYVGYATVVFMLFPFLPQNQALVIMSITGALLLITNLFGIFKLRHEITFAEGEHAPSLRVEESV